MAPESPENLAAVPVGGGGAWPGFEATQAPTVWREPESPENLAAVPVGGGGAWPGFETTRRAKLAARTASGRAAAHGHTEQPGPNRPRRQEHPQRRKQSGSNTRKPRPADAGRGSPTQSGGRV